MKIRAFIFLLIVYLFAFSVLPTRAHGYIVRAIPEDRVTLERAPTRLQYWFSEALEENFSTINVRDQNGEIIATGGLSPDNNTLLQVQLSPDLPDGAYIVELRPAFASDGHVVAESRVFFVGDTVAGVDSQSASDEAIPLEILWRFIVYASSLLLFGVTAVYSGILVPAWGNKKYAAGLLPPRVMRRVQAIIGFSLLAAIAGNVLALLQQAMTFFGVGLAQVIEGQLWAVVRIGSRFGDIWNFRMGFLFIVGVMLLASLYYSSRQPKTVRAFLSAMVWVNALILGSFSVLSHAAGSLILPWVGITVDWTHLLALGFWVGGLAALVLIVPVAMQPYDDQEQQRQILSAVLKRFTRWATGALFVVIATGIYSASNWFYTPDDVTSNFGLSLAIKLALVASLVAVGALHHMALRPERYARIAPMMQRLSRWTATLRLEVIVAILVLGSASLLSSTPVPVPEFATDQIESPFASQTVDELTVSLAISPGGTGVNTYDVVVFADDEPLNNADIQLQNVAPERGVYRDWQMAEAVDDGVYVTASDDFDRVGEWWSLINIVDESGNFTRAAFVWQIDDSSAVITSQPPGIVTLIALVVAIAAVIYAFYPTLERFWSYQEFTTMNISILIWSVAGTAIFMVAGFILLQNVQQEYEAVLEPPPAQVNPVLPDQASLTRGQDIYETQCEWDETSVDFAGLMSRLYRTPDDELLDFIENGWRSLSACDVDLSTDEPWHLLNYIRTLEALRGA